MIETMDHPVVTYQPHPFKRDRAVQRVVVPGTTVMQALCNCGLQESDLTLGSIHVFVNTFHEEHLDRVLQEGDIVEAKFIPAGSETGKNIGRLLFIITATVLFPPYGGVIAAGIVSVEMLVNPPNIASIGGGISAERDIQLLSITGSQNQSNPYGIVPQVIGRHRMYPTYAAEPFTELVGSDQFLRMLFTFGPGDLSVTDIKIGETPIDNFLDVQYELRTGAVGDAAITLFPSQVTETALNLLIDNATGFQTQTTETNTDEIAIDLTFRKGLVDFNKKGRRGNRTVVLDIEYRLVGAGSWTEIGPHNLFLESFTDKTTNTLRVGGSIVPGATAAMGKLTIGVQPSVDDTMTIDSKVYTFKSAVVDGDPDGWIDIHSGLGYASGVSGTRARIIDAINLTGDDTDPSSAYSHQMTVHPSVTARAGVAAEEILITARVAGTGGNSLVSTETFTSGSNLFDASTLGTQQTGTAGTGRGQYEVRMTRTTADTADTTIFDEVHWTALRSIQHDDPITTDYNISKLAIRIKATDQLSNIVDSLNAVVQTKCLDWNGSAWVAASTSNPASLFRHILQGSSNKNPVADARIDLTTLQDWHANNVTAGREFNGIFDNEGTVFQRLQDIASIGRASFTMKEGKYSVIQDKTLSTPIQHFSPRNSRDYRGTKVFDRVVHALKIRFINEDNSWDEDEAIVYDDKAASQVYSGSVAAASADSSYNLSSGNFDAAMFAVNSHVLVSGFTDAGNNGWATVTARTSSKLTVSGLTLVTEAEGDTVTFQSVYGANDATEFETMTLFGVTTSAQAWKMGRYFLAVKRLRPESHEITADIEHLICTRGDLVRVVHDVPILGLTQARIKTVNTTGGGGHPLQITLDSSVTMESGESYDVRIRTDTGVSILRSVTLDVGEQTQITLTAEATDCAVGDLVLFGLNGSESAEMIVKSIEPVDELNAIISLVDYNAAILTADSLTVPPFASVITDPPAENLGRPTGPVIDQVRSDFTSGIPGTGGQENVILRCNIRRPPYRAGAKAYRPTHFEGQLKESNESDTAWRTVTTVTISETDLLFYPVEVGEDYDIRVRTKNTNTSFIVSDWTLSEDHTVVGDDTIPDDIDSASISIVDGKLKWTYADANQPRDFSGFQVRYNEGSADDWSAATLLHTGNIAVPEFDVRHLMGTGSRRFYVKVVDTSGNVSASGESLLFTNTEKLTISSGAVTPTGVLHAIETEGAASTDDLNSMVVTNYNEGAQLTLEAFSTTHDVVLKHAATGSGQMLLKDSEDVTLTATGQFVVFQLRGTDWQEISRSMDRVVEPPTELTISSGDVTVGDFTLSHTIDTESDAASDTLDHLLIPAARPDGSVITISAENAARTVIINDAAGGSGQMLTVDGLSLSLTESEWSVTFALDGTTWRETSRSVAPIILAYAWIGEEVAATTQGGTFTQETWTQRNLNTEWTDVDSIVTISSNQFTLIPGTYVIRWRAPAYQVKNHITRLYDVTGTAVVERGQNQRAEAGALEFNHSVGTASFTITASNTYKLEHYCEQTKTTTGLGRQNTLAGETEVYTAIEIYKIG